MYQLKLQGVKHRQGRRDSAASKGSGPGEPTLAVKGTRFFSPFLLPANLLGFEHLIVTVGSNNEPTPNPAELQTKARNKPHPPSNTGEAKGKGNTGVTALPANSLDTTGFIL